MKASALAFILVLASAFGADAQRRRAPPALRDPVADLALVRDVARAARALLAVTPTAGDANGELRAWDRRWRETLDRLPMGQAYRGGCLLQFDSLSLRLWRDFLGRHPTGRGNAVMSGEDIAWSVAATRWLFEDAVRRLHEDLACEDQPEWHGGGADGVPLLAGCVGEACRPSVDDLLTYAETGRWPVRDAAANVASAPPVATAGTSRPGTLSLISVPVARVVIDGVDSGITPLRIELPAGLHVIDLRDPEGRTRRVEVNLESGVTTRSRVEF